MTIRSYRTPFQKTLKNHEFLKVFGSISLARDPRKGQEAPKKRQNPKSKPASKNPQKCLRGKKCLKVAISFWTKIGTIFGVQICTFLASFLTICCKFFGEFLEPIFETIMWPDQPKRDQGDPKRTIRSWEKPKKQHFKNLKKPLVFTIFLNTDTSQEGLKRPKKSPKRDSEHSKTQTHGIQNWIQKWWFSIQILEPILVPKSEAKKKQNSTNFWDPLPPHLRGPNNAPPKNKREE